MEPFTETGETERKTINSFSDTLRSSSRDQVDSSGMELSREWWAQKQTEACMGPNLWNAWGRGDEAGRQGGVTERKNGNPDVNALRFQVNPHLTSSHTGKVYFQARRKFCLSMVGRDQEPPAERERKPRSAHHPRGQGKRHVQPAWLHLRNQVA